MSDDGGEREGDDVSVLEPQTSQCTAGRQPEGHLDPFSPLRPLRSGSHNRGQFFFSLHFNVTELVDWLLSTLDCFPLVTEDDDFFSDKLIISFFSWPFWGHRSGRFVSYGMYFFHTSEYS